MEANPLGLLKKHHAKFFVAAGTTLGAARSHAIIPWTSDNDLALDEISKLVLEHQLRFLAWNNLANSIGAISKSFYEAGLIVFRSQYAGNDIANSFLTRRRSIAAMHWESLQRRGFVTIPN